MAGSSDDFVLTPADLREVARYVCGFAADVLPVFEQAHPEDPRPREALTAGLAFAGGQPRSQWQRRASMGAHRAATAARTAGDEVGALAAQAAGDAASAAYLHPIAKAHQVAHILRAAANAAAIARVDPAGSGHGADRVVELAIERAGPQLVAILRRYPAAPPGAAPAARLMATIDALVRARS